MAVIRELVARLGFEVDSKGVDKFDKKIDEARDGMKQAGSQAEKTAKRLEALGAAAKRGGAIAVKAIGAVTAAVTAAAAAGAALTKGFAETADQFAKDAQRFGTTAESLQELSIASQFSGTEVGKLQDGLKSLSVGLNDLRTKGTGPVAEGLAALGVSADDARLQGDDLIEITTALADEFAGMEDGAQKAAAAQKLFGGAGLELIPLLNSGAQGIAAMRQEARDLGGVISNETAASAEAFNDDLLRLETQLGGIKNEIAAELLPVFREIVTEVGAWLKENRALVRTRVKGFIKGIVDAAKALAPILKTLVENWQIIAGLFAAQKISAGFNAAAAGLRAMGIAAGSALGPIGLVASALAALIPVAISAGNAIGDALVAGGRGPTVAERGGIETRTQQVEAGASEAAVFGDQARAQSDFEREDKLVRQLEAQGAGRIQLRIARDRRADAKSALDRSRERIKAEQAVAKEFEREREGLLEQGNVEADALIAQFEAEADAKDQAAAEKKAGKKRRRGGGGRGKAAKKADAPSINDLIAGALGQPGVGATGIRGVGPGTTINRIDASINAPTTISIEIPAGVLAGRTLEEQSRAIGQIAGREIDRRNQQAFDSQKSQIVG